MKKSLINKAILIACLTAVSAAQAEVNPHEMAAAFDQFHHGYSEFQKKGLNPNQYDDYRNEAYAGLRRMGLSGSAADKAFNSATAFKNPAEVVSFVATPVTASVAAAKPVTFSPAQGADLSKANLDRTASQDAALNAARAERFHQLKAEAEAAQGAALTADNVDRTAAQNEALNTARAERFHAIKGEALTADNVDRTSAQNEALNAARAEHFHALKGEALAADNVDRTAAQNEALNAARAERFHQIKGEALTADNVDRTAAQNEALNAARAERFHQIKGEALTADNVDRTSAQVAALKGSELTAANQERTAPQAEAQKGAELVAANQSRTAGQVEALKGAELAAANQSRTAPQAEALKGAELTAANQARTAKQAVTAKEAQQEATTYAQPKDVDQAIHHESAIRRSGDAAALRAANAYTDSQMAGVNSRLDSQDKKIKDTSERTKRTQAMSQALTSLHYNGNVSGYAVGAGAMAGKEAIAGGLQYGIDEHHAVTMQSSWDGEDAGLGVGFHGDF
ncbi:hypothetical protein ACJVQT_23185 [Enterobacter huaxiensis]|uniref:hypothetical protein n=1 Tax=Enterobacter huaxiensis TaxID=2494702 RepID=UPI0021760BA2|nr:hypothetical protein [Enterobacter huaxiensis]MCS5452483.1 hypothetical protein [Enterobacter huaxiensis]